MAIARGEWVRDRRARVGLSVEWLLLAVVAGGFGWAMYGIGRAVTAGETVPSGTIGVAASTAMAWVA